MINYYKHQLCLNCLCKDIKNAEAILKVMDGNVLIGLLSADYESVDAALSDMESYQKTLKGHISVGLGGDICGHFPLFRIEIGRAHV